MTLPLPALQSDTADSHPSSTDSNPPKKRQKNEKLSRENAELAFCTVIEQRGLDPKCLKVSNLTSIADYFIVCSATSERHAQGIADKVKHAFDSHQNTPLSISGYEGGEWIVLDYSDVVVHVFYEPLRQYYNLDKLWESAEVMQPPKHLEDVIKKLRTGCFG